ncbi:MAG: antitoxin VbhA family protein [Cytobacillus gottheilii]|uniref:antitoxin VbhA family protein n=1 Tax=Cytobacillus gottheilii TaxID=859144 RepID=UPI000A82B55B|nr:antitoxin VbhA family protein [Cytobacillus gottheilii]
MNKAKVDIAIKSAKASLAVEGLYLTQREEDLVRSNLQGEITDEEFEKKVLELTNES